VPYKIASGVEISRPGIPAGDCEFIHKAMEIKALAASASEIVPQLR